MAIIYTLTSYLKSESETQWHQCEGMKSDGEQNWFSEEETDKMGSATFPECYVLSIDHCNLHGRYKK